MKHAFADMSSVTITVPPVFIQGDVGSGIVASLSNIRDRQMEADQSMSHFQPASWPGGLPQWVPFSPQQQGQLQPRQQQTAFMPSAVTGGDTCNATSDPAQPTAQQQHAGMVSAGSFGKFPLVGTLIANPISTQLSSSRIPLPEGQMLQADSQHAAGEVTATVSISARPGAAAEGKTGLISPHNIMPAGAAVENKGGLVASDNLLSELQAQLQMRQDAAAQAGSWLPPQPPSEQQQQQPCIPLDELQLLLPAVHAEYKAEMRLMLRACQVATSVTRHSTAAGTTLLLDPSSRDQLQRQVLQNCNEKHAAVSAAFKLAAQAIEAAAAAAGCTGAPAEGLLSSKLLGIGAAEGPTAPPAAAPAAAAASGNVGASMSCVWQRLQQLRGSYQQELVAATSALFAICRGFGQRYVLGPAATGSIKAALAAAQRQHGRVEQLWQDVVLAAGGA